MKKLPVMQLALTTAITLALSACGGSGYTAPAGATVPPQAPVSPVAPGPIVNQGDVYVLTSTQLLTVNSKAPGTIVSSATIVGLQPGETLLGIDFRPADNLLYGVGSSGRIYTISASGGAVLKSTLAADAADTTAPFTGLAGTEFGVDFNPAADRLRVVSNTGQSLRINVDTGATTTDGNINGGAANAAVTAAAYTNSFAGTGSTTLLVIDAANSTLYTQNPPNNGTLSVPVPLGVTATSVSAFDIDARNNTGYAVMTVGGVRTLYTVNLAAAANPLTAVGAIAGTDPVRGLAVLGSAGATPVTMVYGLTDDARLVGFKPLTPGTLDSAVTITGLNAGEKLLGIDFRPKDGLLYGISSLGRIVTIDATTGAATVKVTLAADAADTTQPYTGVAGTAFGVDFNPVADRLRVISNTGQSLRINVDTGATTTDGAINRVGGAPVVTAAAYTNSFAGTTATQLFDIDTATSSLALQNPPNDGTLTNIGSLGVTVAGDVGFDIAGGANGLALAALRTTATGASSIYRIDLATGAATLVNGATTPANSQVGGATGLIDLAISFK